MNQAGPAQDPAAGAALGNNASLVSERCSGRRKHILQTEINNGKSAPIPPITMPIGNTIGNTIGNSIGNSIKKNPDFPDTPFKDISIILKLFLKKR